MNDPDDEKHVIHHHHYDVDSPDHYARDALIAHAVRLKIPMHGGNEVLPRAQS